MQYLTKPSHFLNFRGNISKVPQVATVAQTKQGFFCIQLAYVGLWLVYIDSHVPDIMRYINVLFIYTRKIEPVTFVLLYILIE
jgi:hypothetical protein